MVKMDVQSKKGNGKKESRRKKVLHFVERPKFHIFIISLVMLDLCLVMAELVLNLYIAEEECGGKASHHDIESLETAEEIVGHISFALLCLFVVELSVRLWATGFKEFFKHWFNYVDIFAIFGLFIVEVIFTYAKVQVGHDPSVYSKVLIILRMIRVIRMLHAVAHAIEMMDEDKLNALKEANCELEEKLIEMNATVLNLNGAEDKE